jgi:hypothetical protein
MGNIFQNIAAAEIEKKMMEDPDYVPQLSTADGRLRIVNGSTESSGQSEKMYPSNSDGMTSPRYANSNAMVSGNNSNTGGGANAPVTQGTNTVKKKSLTGS